MFKSIIFYIIITYYFAIPFNILMNFTGYTNFLNCYSIQMLFNSIFYFSLIPGFNSDFLAIKKLSFEQTKL